MSSSTNGFGLGNLYFSFPYRRKQKSMLGKKEKKREISSILDKYYLIETAANFPYIEKLDY